MIASTPPSHATAGTRHAVAALAEVIANGELASYLVVDKKSGEPLHPEARQLFSALPTVVPHASPDEIVEFGLWSRPPHNLRKALESPRYRPGREIFVRTNTTYAPADRYRPAGSYDASLPVGFTHRAELRGQTGDAVVVAVDDAPSLMRFSRSDVFAWNEPTPMPVSGSLSGVQFDYNDPMVKAHVCAAYIELASAALELDFNAAPEVVQQKQVQLVHRLAARVRMTYTGLGDGYSGIHAGALLSGGQGVCFVQRAVAMVLLAPFARTLGFDVQAAVGCTLRLSAMHGFLVLTLRPSLSRYVVDPAWGEPLTDLRVAFFDNGFGHDRKLVGFEGAANTGVPPEAIALPEVASS